GGDTSRRTGSAESKSAGGSGDEEGAQIKRKERRNKGQGHIASEKEVGQHRKDQIGVLNGTQKGIRKFTKWPRLKFAAAGIQGVRWASGARRDDHRPPARHSSEARTERSP